MMETALHGTSLDSAKCLERVEVRPLGPNEAYNWI